MNKKIKFFNVNVQNFNVKHAKEYLQEKTKKELKETRKKGN